MLWGFLVGIAIWRTNFACNAVADAVAGLAIDSNSTGGNGSECSPFQSLNEALAAAALVPVAKLNAISSEIALSGLWTIENKVTILGLPSVLRVSGTVTVKGSLELVYVKLIEEQARTDPLFSCLGGTLHLYDSQVLSASSSLVAHYSGTVEVIRSTIHSLTATAFALHSAACFLSLVNSSFSEIADLIEVDSTLGGGSILLERLTITNSAHFLHVSELIQGILQINLRHSLIQQSSKELFSGNLGNLTVETFNLTVVDSQQIVQGSLVNSVFTFDQCSFLRIHQPLFDLSALQGELSITYSNISQVTQGPVVLIPANPYPPTSAFVYISGCLISNVTNLSAGGLCNVILGVSVTFRMKDTEVWGATVIEGGLLKLTGSVAELSNIYYHDSSAVLISFFEGIALMLKITNLVMTRVSNDQVLFGMCVFGGECHWDNVTITDSIDPDIETAQAFVLFATAYFALGTVRNSYFHNPGPTLLCMGANDDGMFEVHDSIFVEVNSPQAFLSLTRASVLFDNVTFVSPHVDVLFRAYYSSNGFTLSRLRFEGNSQVSTFVSMDNAAVTVSHSTLEGIEATVFRASNSILTLFNVTVSRLGGFLCRNCVNSQFTLTALTVQNSSTPILFDILYSSVNFIDLLMQNVTCSQLITLTNCQMSMTGASFQQLTVDSFGGLITATASTLLINSTLMTQLFSILSIHIGLIYLDTSALRIQNCHFSRFNATLIYSVRSPVSIVNSEFSDGGLYEATPNKVVRSLGSVLWGVSVLSVDITNCHFSNLSADEGGVLYLSGTGVETCTINQITAEHNWAKKGGFLYSQQVFVTITWSEINSNHALQGGALWITGTKGELLVKLENSCFFNNSASLDGGAIFRLSCTYSISNCQWTNNTAEYGPNIASQIASFAMVSNETSEIIQSHYVSAVSGQLYQDIVFIGCLDDLGQVMKTDNSSKLNLFTVDANSSVTTSTLLEAQKGVFMLPKMRIVGQPGSLLPVYGSLASDFSQLLFSVRLRDCISGEHFHNMQCVPCTHNTYSFDPAEACNLCPDHADCPTGDRLVLHAGYWRSSTTVADIYECLVPELCKGGYSSDCSIGHSGTMCSQCTSDFFKVNQLQCITCINKGVAAVKDIASLVVAAISTFFMLKHDQMLVHMVVFDYLHSMRILVNYNIYWPSSIAYLYSVAGDIGSLGLTAFTEPCLGAITNIETVYSQLVVSVLYFLLLIAFVFAVGFAFRFFFQVFKARTIAKVGLYLAYLMLPMLMLRTLTMFPCYKIDSRLFLIYNPSVECWSSKHLAYSLGLSLPVFLLGLSVPCFLLMDAVVSTPGVLSKPHRWQCFCFAIFLLRKYALTCLLVFSTALTLSTQVSFVILLNLATEASMYRGLECKSMFFFSLYEISLISTTLLSFFCVIYEASTSSITDKETAFIIVNYGCLLAPAAFCAVHLFWNCKHQREQGGVERAMNNTPFAAPVDHAAEHKSGAFDGSSALITLRPPNPSPEC